jgi:hypothetical protein
MNKGLSADDIGRGYSATLGPELVERRGDEVGGLDGHASDAWALGACLCMLLARDATLSFTNLTTDLDRWPASSTAPAVAVTSVGERQRRLYHLVFPANAVPLHLRRESRFGPLVDLAERLLRHDPAQRPPPDTVFNVLESSKALLASLHCQAVLGWKVTARHMSPSDDVREAWAGRSTPLWLRWCVRSQLYWAHVFFNPEAAWRREACIARGVVLPWAAFTWITLAWPCLSFLCALGTPGYCAWFSLVLPHVTLQRYTSIWVTLCLWVVHLGGSVVASWSWAVQTRAARFPFCAALGLALWPLWQALVTWLPAECRTFAVLGAPTSIRAETATSAAQATHRRASWSWAPFVRARSKIDYPSEAALRSELAALRELARSGGAPPACTLTARDACDGVGTYRLTLTIDVEPLSALVTRPGAYTSWEAWVWLHQVAGALAYLHDRGTHHGNLNLESILITSKPHGRQVRLCRFGQAPDTSTAFASPEKADSVAVGQGGAPYDEAAADVWSLGVLVVTLLSRQPAPPPGEFRRLGGAAAAEDQVFTSRFFGVAELCGLCRQDKFYTTPEWARRSRFVHFITLAEWALRLLPSQRPSAAQAELSLSASSVFVWRTHGAGVFRLPSLRRRWREDLVDLLSPPATGLPVLLRQAVKVQVFWALTLSAEPQHAHLRRAFDRASALVLVNVLASLALFLSCTTADEAQALNSTLRDFPYVTVVLLLAPPDVDQVWVCAAPKLARAQALANRTFSDSLRTELKYLCVLLVGVTSSDYPLPAWFWPALGAVVAGRVLVVVGCAQLWVHSVGYVGRPQQHDARAGGEGQPAGVELAGRLSLLEHALYMCSTVREVKQEAPGGGRELALASAVLVECFWRGGKALGITPLQNSYPPLLPQNSKRCRRPDSSGLQRRAFAVKW